MDNHPKKFFEVQFSEWTIFRKPFLRKTFFRMDNFPKRFFEVQFSKNLLFESQTKLIFFCLAIENFSCSTTYTTMAAEIIEKKLHIDEISHRTTSLCTIFQEVNEISNALYWYYSLRKEIQNYRTEPNLTFFFVG